MKETKNNPLIEFFKNINLAIYELVHAGEFDTDVDLKEENELLTEDPIKALNNIQASTVPVKTRARVSSIPKGKAPEAEKAPGATKIKISRTQENVAANNTQENIARNGKQKNIVRNDEHEI